LQKIGLFVREHFGVGLFVNGFFVIGFFCESGFSTTRQKNAWGSKRIFDYHFLGHSVFAFFKNLPIPYMLVHDFYLAINKKYNFSQKILKSSF
jgi:hypothetical protein